MEIIHVGAELAPIAKVGGLADVLHGLSRSLLGKKHKVKVILPKYDTLDLNGVQHLEVIDSHHTIQFDGKMCSNTLWQGIVDGIPVIFVESHDKEEFFERKTIYGCPDDIARFSYFCLAALKYIRTSKCDVVHLHDWHTALLAGLIKELHPEIKAQVVFTIHNLSYQGLCKNEDLEKVGWKSPLLKEGGVYNLLKGGIIFADQVTTVSPTYAHEILTTDLGGGLRGTLQQYQRKLTGVLNGIDYAYWNPETDPHLPWNFSLGHLENKKKVKHELRKRLSLANENCPLAGAVTRLVPQKGPELIKAAILRTLEWGGQFVLLGSALDENTHTHFYNLKRKLAGSEHVHLELTYNEELSHLLFAGSDLFLAPSLFEPCGLTQLISMRYGTVPLVRQTGGFTDTVFEEKNGFLFGPPTAEAINESLDRAFKTWYEQPEKWNSLVEAGMTGDYSWDKPAEEYLKLYRSATISPTKIS